MELSQPGPRRVYCVQDTYPKWSNTTVFVVHGPENLLADDDQEGHHQQEKDDLIHGDHPLPLKRERVPPRHFESYPVGGLGAIPLPAKAIHRALSLYSQAAFRRLAGPSALLRVSLCLHRPLTGLRAG